MTQTSLLNLVKKQNTFVEGANISIDTLPNVISATGGGTNFTAGENLTLSNNL